MKIRLYLFLLLSAVFLTTCEFESDSPILPTNQEYNLYDLYEDEYGNKGIVAYVYPYDYFGHIIVVSLDETEASWGPMGELVYTGDADEKYINQSTFGLAVLQSMKVRGIENYPAQAWCDQKNGPSSSPNAASWRMPSHYEMYLIFGSSGTKVTSLNSYIVKYGGERISKNDIYWTCVEDFDDYLIINGQTSDYDKENRAIAQTPTNKVYGNKDRWIKKNTYRVRAIKYIYYE